MKLLVGPRQSGKTTEAIKLANENDAYLAVRSQEMATNVYHSESYPDLERFPITYDELLEGMARSRVRTVVIDDLEAFVAQLLPGIELAAASMTVGETIELEKLTEING